MGEDDSIVGSEELILEIATIHMAKALGFGEEGGSIEVAKKADFIGINMDAPHLAPAWDPVSTLVYAAHGSDVDTVVIDGQIVMRGREVLPLNEEGILEDIHRRH